MSSKPSKKPSLKGVIDFTPPNVPGNGMTMRLIPEDAVVSEFIARAKKLPKSKRDHLIGGLAFFLESSRLLVVRLEIWEQNQRNRKAGRV